MGEAYAIAKFTEKGFRVSKPLSENCPYDLIVDYNGDLYKIQVKTTNSCKDGTMKYEISRTNPFKYTKEKYNSGEVDFFFLYCIETEWCGLISLEEAPVSQLNIHYNFPANNNFNGYKMQHDFEFNYKINEIKEKTKMPKHDISNLIPRTKQEEKIIKILDSIENRTTREKLKSEIRVMPFTEVGRIYGVTDNAIRKWCVKMGLPNKTTLIKMYTDEDWENV